MSRLLIHSHCTLLITAILLQHMLLPVAELVVENTLVGKFLQKRENVGYKTIVRYTEMVAAVDEEVTLDCKVPVATDFDWQMFGMNGSPFAKGIKLIYNGQTSEPWQRIIDHATYHWEVLVIACSPRLNFKKLITIVWVITKLRTSTDKPFHPVTCSIKGAKCLPGGTECYYGTGSDYRGKARHTKSGLCQGWSSTYPHAITSGNKYNVDAFGLHNYCRSPPALGVTQPHCYTSAPVSNPLEPCFVPKCADCAYGDGDGRIEGFNLEFPKYLHGSQLTTVRTQKTEQGSSLVRCYGGDKAWLERNTCSVSKPQSLPTAKTQPKEAWCLIRIKKSKSDEIPIGDSARSPDLEIEKCALDQCLVRQVFFLFITPDGQVLYDSPNDQKVQLEVMEGEESIVQFVHFGTLRCTELSARSIDSLASSLPFRLECKESPQLSKLVFDRPDKYSAGSFYLQYEFKIGHPSLQSKLFKANFDVVVTSPTTISLVSTKACPGMNAKVTIQQKGSFPIDPSTVKWLFSQDGQKWLRPELAIDHADLASDGMSLLLKNLQTDNFVKVNSTARSGPVSATLKITLNVSPRLEVEERNIEAKPGAKVKLVIEYDSDAITRWIFGRTILNQEKPENLMSFTNEATSNPKTSRQTLQISAVNKDHQGIYNVDVERDGCVTSSSIYLSLA